MELCKENLMGRIFQNRDNIPSLSLTPGATRSVIRWARDIANALEFIHSQGIVHRDFKLENIIVSTKNGTRIISYFRVAYDKKNSPNIHQLCDYIYTAFDKNHRRLSRKEKHM